MPVRKVNVKSCQYTAGIAVSPDKSHNRFRSLGRIMSLWGQIWHDEPTCDGWPEDRIDVEMNQHILPTLEVGTISNEPWFARFRFNRTMTLMSLSSRQLVPSLGNSITS
jgi:hypothetical protein